MVSLDRATECIQECKREKGRQRERRQKDRGERARHTENKRRKRCVLAARPCRPVSAPDCRQAKGRRRRRRRRRRKTTLASPKREEKRRRDEEGPKKGKEKDRQKGGNGRQEPENSGHHSCTPVRKSHIKNTRNTKPKNHPNRMTELENRKLGQRKLFAAAFGCPKTGVSRLKMPPRTPPRSQPELLPKDPSHTHTQNLRQTEPCTKRKSARSSAPKKHAVVMWGGG